MVNQRISEDIKECAFRLWNHGWDVEDVCEAFGVSRFEKQLLSLEIDTRRTWHHRETAVTPHRTYSYNHARSTVSYSRSICGRRQSVSRCSVYMAGV